VRVKVSTVVLTAAAALAALVVAVVLLRSGPTPGAAQTPEPQSRPAWSARKKPRSVPRFQSNEAAPPAQPPPRFVEPPPPQFEPPSPEVQLRERASKDGFMFREEGDHRVFIVQGGTKYYIPSDAEFEALGLRRDQIEEIPRGALSHLPSRPKDRVLLRERDSQAVFYYENGQKRWINSPETFQRMGYKWSDVKIVPSGSLQTETTGPPVQ
jgi:hypothetical protein